MAGNKRVGKGGPNIRKSGTYRKTAARPGTTHPGAQRASGDAVRTYLGNLDTWRRNGGDEFLRRLNTRTPE